MTLTQPQQKALDALRQGGTLEAAAELLGVQVNTAARWARRLRLVGALSPDEFKPGKHGGARPHPVGAVRRHAPLSGILYGNLDKTFNGRTPKARLHLITDCRQRGADCWADCCCGVRVSALSPGALDRAWTKHVGPRADNRQTL